MHYLIKTSEEINALAALFNGGSTPLPSTGGKSLKDIFGAKKQYNQDYYYSVPSLDDKLINNPEHPSFGKYVVPVFIEDIQAHAPSEEANLLTEEELGEWRIND